MHRPGHYGASLAVYSPVGFVLTAFGASELAILGGAVVVGGAMLPDLDQRVPFIQHRGPTHTIWFMLLVASVFAVTGLIVGMSSTGLIAGALLASFGALVGATMIGAHLLADALTPMGIQPFKPLRNDKYTLDIAKAANPIANYALLVAGGVLAGVAFIAGSVLAT